MEKVGNTTTSAGSSSQEMLSGEGPICRLQVIGWHGVSGPLFPEVPKAVNQSDQPRSRKALVGSLWGV